MARVATKPTIRHSTSPRGVGSRSRFAPSKKPTAKHDSKGVASGAWALKDFVSLYDADPMTRVEMVRTGVPAKDLTSIASGMRMANDRLIKVIGAARATVNRKARGGQRLSADESERLIGVARLVGQVQAMVAQQPGNPIEFDAAQWVADWIGEPVPALGDRRPADLLDTLTGQEAVSNVLHAMQSGTYL